jgi:hypothetical protein
MIRILYVAALSRQQQPAGLLMKPPKAQAYVRKKLEEMSDAGADGDNDGSGAHATSKASEEVAPALPPPQLPEWKANALPSPESYSSGSVSDSSSVGSTFENNFRDIINQAEECAIIESIVEDYTLEADAAEAEVVDTNTIAPISCRHKKMILLSDVLFQNLTNVPLSSELKMRKTPLSGTSLRETTALPFLISLISCSKKSPSGPEGSAASKLIVVKLASANLDAGASTGLQ